METGSGKTERRSEDSYLASLYRGEDRFCSSSFYDGALTSSQLEEDQFHVLDACVEYHFWSTAKKDFENEWKIDKVC
jgi:hypothetical protein